MTGFDPGEVTITLPAKALAEVVNDLASEGLCSEELWNAALPELTKVGYVPQEGGYWMVSEPE